jgi:hypothetical protein
MPLTRYSFDERQPDRLPNILSCWRWNYTSRIQGSLTVSQVSSRRKSSCGVASFCLTLGSLHRIHSFAYHNIACQQDRYSRQGGQPLSATNSMADTDVIVHKPCRNCSRFVGQTASSREQSQATENKAGEGESTLINAN